MSHDLASRPGTIVVVEGATFAHCSDCGEPVGRDRDRGWCHLDDPYRRMPLFDDRPPHPDRPAWVCPNDTDGDGNCATCHRLAAGCPLAHPTQGGR